MTSSSQKGREFTTIEMIAVWFISFIFETVLKNLFETIFGIFESLISPILGIDFTSSGDQSPRLSSRKPHGILKKSSNYA
mmetsp:Transcript_2708/g.2359  ORF Transcript_2708/g.2359 Transcript_2708/m.2359 type:complete len:80 (+) Transcript_2708:97-336(+)